MLRWTSIEMVPAAGDESSPTRPLWTRLHPIEPDGEGETRDGTIQVEGGGAEGDGEQQVTPAKSKNKTWRTRASSVEQ